MFSVPLIVPDKVKSKSSNNNDDEDDDFYAGAMHKNTFGNNRDNDLYSII